MTAPTTRETADHAELLEDALEALQIIDAFPSNQGEVEGRITEKGDRILAACTADIRACQSALLSEIAALRVALEKTASDFREVAEAHTQALDLLHLFDDHLGEDEPMWTDESTVTGEWIGSDGIRHSLTFGMFRRVRAFLAPRGADQ